MDSRSTTQPTADNAITSDMSSMAPNKVPETSTEKLTREKSSLTGMPCITIKDISALEQGQVSVSLTINDSFNKTESQLPQTQSVFPDLLQCLLAQLTDCYTKTSFVNKRLFDTDYFSLADYFVNLQVVVKADETNEGTKSNDDKYSHKPLRARDRLAGKKEAIAQDDLFQPLAYQDANGKSPPSIDTVVVSGAAGVGKTTLLDYIAYQWGLFAHGQGKTGLWSGFETVLIVRCRELLPGNLMPDNQHWDIAHLVYRACWKDLSLPESGAQELLSKLQEKPNKCLLLLDGLDELPAPETDYWRSLLGQLFRLPFKKLVTTRPYAIGNLPQWLRHDRLVEIQGFSDTDVPTFFKRHLGATEPTSNFIKDIKQNPDLWAIVHIPINAYLLKTWWETTCQQGKPVLLNEMSVSDLYESLMVNVCRRYLAKIGELDENKLLDGEMVLEVPSIRCLLDTLGCWAFEGLRQDTAQLPISWLKGVQGSDESPTLLSANRLKQLNVPTLKALGLLKQVGHAIRAHQMYEFLHLSFQEFLAANVIAVTFRQCTEEKKTHLTQVIHRYKYHPNFTLVWPSVAGLLSRYPTALDDFLSILVAGPKDWVGFVEFDLLMRCLESSLHSSTDINALGLRQQTLLRAVKQRIRRFNELPLGWHLIKIETFSICPRLIRLNVDTVLAFFRGIRHRSDLTRSPFARLLQASARDRDFAEEFALSRNKMVRDSVYYDLARGLVAQLSQTPEFADEVLAFFRNEMVRDSVHYDLASSAAAYLSPTPELEDAVWAFLRDETVDEYFRIGMAESAVALLSQTPEFVDAVWAFLWDEAVSDSVRAGMMKSAFAHLSQPPKFVDTVLAFLRDETLSDFVRSTLAISTAAHLSQNPEFVDAVLALLRDETVRVSTRIGLAEGAVAHLSQIPEFADEVLAFFRNKTIRGSVRVKLVRSAAAHLSQAPEFVDAVWALLRDETVDYYVCGDLARDVVAHLSQTPEFMDVVWTFLWDEAVDCCVRRKLASSAVAHLSQIPEFVDAVWAFLWNEAVNKYVRGDLASSAVAHLSQTPKFVCAVWAFLRDETVSDFVRGDLASSAVAHLSQIPEFVDAVLAFLRDETVRVSIRIKLAKDAVAHLSQTPEFADAVLALFRNETVESSVRGDLARSAIAHLSPTPELVDVVLVFLRDEQMDDFLRGDLAISTVANLSQIPECVDAVSALIRDETVDDHVRGNLVRNAVAHLSQFPKFVDAVCEFLQDETVSKYVRGSLARGVVENLPQTPECVDAAWAFLRDETVSKCVRGPLERRATQLLPKWSNKILAFLDSLFVKDSVGDALLQHTDIPVHLLLPLYNKTHYKRRQYIRKQLVKHRVLVYEQAGDVLVTQAGQTEKLTLPPPLIQQIQKDLQAYRINIDDSASTLSKLGLFSKSVMSFFSSQYTEKSSGQTSRSNIGYVTQ